MYCNDKKPRLSILIETLFDGISALVEGFSNDVLYLNKEKKNYVSQQMNFSIPFISD